MRTRRNLINDTALGIRITEDGVTIYLRGGWNPTKRATNSTDNNLAPGSPK